MREAYVDLRCPRCAETWEENVADLPAPGRPFSCDHCGERRPTSEFMHTARDLEILEEFQ